MIHGDCMDYIKWPGIDHSLKDFVDQVRFKMPVLAMTTTGFAGCDEDMHQIGANEVYWVYDIQRQRRIVAKVGKDQYLSIPTDYQLKFHILHSTGGGKSTPDPAVTCQQLADELKSRGEPFWAKVESRTNVHYQVGAESSRSAKFDQLQVLDTYEEKYLLTYGIHGGRIHSVTIPIPVYMDITMGIASGFKYGDNKQFLRWMEEVKQIANGYVSTPVKACDEIIMFSDPPSSGNYEYFRPVFRSAFLPAFEKTSTSDRELTAPSTDRDYVGITRPENQYHQPNAAGPPPPRPAKKVHPIRQTSVSRSTNPANQKSVISTVLPHVPLRPLPSSPDKAEDQSGSSSPTTPSVSQYEEPDEWTGHVHGNEHVQGAQGLLCLKGSNKGFPVVSCVRKESLTTSPKETSPKEPTTPNYEDPDAWIKDRPAPAIPSKTNTSAAVGASQSQRIKQKGSVGASQAPSGGAVSPPQLTHLRSKPILLPPGAFNYQDFAVENVPAGASMSSFTAVSNKTVTDGQRLEDPTTADHVTVGSHLEQYSSMSEVPLNLDVARLTKADVLQCLRLLKLGQYQDVFDQNEVDGTLLVRLNDSDLCNDFLLKGIDAKRLMMFTKEGWRPK